jgi:glycerol-3-phosphate acyltransferase PlsY
MFAGLGCILGHNWPVYFNFKGGKGVLTSFAVMIMMGPIPTLIVFVFFLVMVIITRYISLSSLLAAAILPFIGGIFGKALGITNIKGFIIFTTIIAALIIYRHHSNIKRLLNGTETRFKLSKSRKDGE